MPACYWNSVIGTLKLQGEPEGTCKYLSTTFLVCRLTTNDKGIHRNQLLKQQEKQLTSGCDQCTKHHMGSSESDPGEGVMEYVVSLNLNFIDHDN
jgi:hypothetical protein